MFGKAGGAKTIFFSCVLFYLKTNIFTCDDFHVFNKAEKPGHYVLSYPLIMFSVIALKFPE